MHVAGAEVLVAETIRRLGQRIAPVVLCLDGVGPLGEQMRAEGVPVIGLGRRPGLDVAVARRMAAELRVRQVQVVHAHQYTPFFYGAIARLLPGMRFRLILTEHGRHYPDVVSAKRRLVNRWMLARLADDVNAVCEFSARALQRLDGFSAQHVHVIENGIDVPNYTVADDKPDRRARLGFDAARRLVLCVARFHPVKDHRMLLNAFAKVAGAFLDVDLVLAGDGELRCTLEEQARAMGLNERVRFLGVRRDVPELLAAADAFVLTSVSEGASLTVMEALASGVPAVVTNVGGNPEIVRDGQEGLLVPRGDHEATARALGALLADRALAQRMGRAGRARAEQQYQLDDTVRRHYETYVKAVAEPADRFTPPMPASNEGRPSTT